MPITRSRLPIILCYFLSFMLLGFVLCTKKYFGHVTFDQILFVFILDPSGMMQSDHKTMWRYIVWCFNYPIVLALLIVYLKTICAHCASFFMLIKNVASHYFFVRLVSMGAFLTLLTSIGYFGSSFRVQEVFYSYFKNQHDDYFKEYYADLTHVPLTTTKAENLLLIYVESFENTYQNKEVFGGNLLSPLTPWQEKGIWFERSTQLPGTSWTLASIIATQCGIPLKFYNNQQTEKLKKFLPHAVCLTDVLAGAGYENVFMKGASLTFSGLSQFLKTHQVHEMYGKEEWLKKGYSLDKMSSWGLHDEDLYQEATIKLDHLFKQKKPFNLTLLTVDLHGPDVYISPYCKHFGARNYEGVVRCQAAMLSSFLDDLQKRGWLQKLNVVIMGDHLVMRNPLSPQLSTITERQIFNLILPTSPITKVTDEIVHFSWFPSILTLLNFNLPNEHAGIGFSAIEKITDQNKDNHARHVVLNGKPEQLLMPSRRYQALWG